MSPNKTITVRLSEEQYEQVKRAAHQAECSMNALCVRALEGAVAAQAMKVQHFDLVKKCDATYRGILR